MFITAGVGWDGTCVPWHKSGGQGITFGSQLSYHLGFQGSSGVGSKYLYLLNRATGQLFKLNVHACLYLYVGGPRRDQRTTRSWFSPSPMWIVGFRLGSSAWGSQLLLAKASHQPFLVLVFIPFFEKAQAENFIMPVSVFWTVCALFHLKKESSVSQAVVSKC